MAASANSAATAGPPCSPAAETSAAMSAGAGTSSASIATNANIFTISGTPSSSAATASAPAGWPLSPAVSTATAPPWATGFTFAAGGATQQRPQRRLRSYQHVDPSRRGSTLSPGDEPLQPGQYIEGTGGFYKLGWIPGLRWKPKLVISPDGEMVAQRRDGSEVILAGPNAGNIKENVGLLCRGERLLRRVAHVAAPEYGARSQQGRLLLGREHFCSMDASPATVSTVDVARLWLKGGGVLGFSEDGDIEMVASSGELVWSLAQDQDGVEMSETWRMSKTDKGELTESQREAARKKIENMKQDRQQRAKDFKRRQETRNEEKRKERDDAKRNKKRGRTKLFGPKAGAARDAVNDIASPSSEATPPRHNIFVRVLSWARQPSPKGTGGQSG